MAISAADLIIRPSGTIYHLDLHPDQLCDRIIVVGDPNRVEQVSRHFDVVYERVSSREFVTHTGRLNNQPIMVISSGIGVDNVEIVMTELDALANINLETRTAKTDFRKLEIIRIGTSGALPASIPVDGTVISEFGIGLDSLFTFYNLPQSKEEQRITKELVDKTGLISPPYLVNCSANLLEQFRALGTTGSTVTCPGFYAPQGRRLRLAPRLRTFLNQLKTFSPLNITNFEMETSGYYAMGRLLGHEMLSINAIVANRSTKEFSSRADKTIEELITKVLEKL